MFTLNFLFLVPLILGLYLHIRIFGTFYYHYDFIVSQFEDTDDVFDFIVVGGGSAGAVVAARLSSNNKVLLLEAGGDPLPLQSIPALVTEFVDSPSLVGQEEKHSRRTKLGGSSSLNYMIYVRSHPYDYDTWANMTGDLSWKYEKVLPYFRKSLSKYDGQYKGNSKHYGSNGQQKVGLYVENKPEQDVPILPYVIKASEELSYESVSDLNAPQRTAQQTEPSTMWIPHQLMSSAFTGFGSVDWTLKNGARYGTFHAYLKPVAHRKNLVISRYSHATKIKLDGNNQATGVWYTRHGKKRLARARKEIVISGGAVGSPQLLMLSGIGPEDSLRRVNIKPRITLPVGQNLKDHLAVTVPVILEKPHKNISIFVESDYNPLVFFNYLRNGQGPFSVPHALNSLGFVSTSNQSAMSWPNIQLNICNLGISNFLYQGQAKLLGFKKEPQQQVLKDHFGKQGIMSVIVLVKPKSVGEILLRDKDPLSYPLINPNYLQHPEDVRALIEDMKIQKRLFEETQSFQGMGAQMSRESWPDCEEHEIFTDKYWECFVRHVGVTLYHPVGTCAMGKTSNPNAVVDSSLRVLHSRWLRVVDASIMPDIVNGNTHAATVMIAEKASDLIREYWSKQFLICPYLDYLFSSKFGSKCYYSSLT